ncbi:Protein-lysine N-methyltransferase efm4 [Yamadazyma tenuis]|uniref:Protein-lysine N-methyltransferase EFM4 n=1 Tax=Candida tenuis (strain ATCC 10573 / BCRC 21748 / CBS 615 / JCM 9827 / NBRC 10315 / NRRL Y-1498 / VKM Y-70) TaxID=590646 RepID=G3BAS9_CANTC|nr:uncharacterized protein CANTEDRAFT_131521 [Yamadazyma tenuis ATCC 10573]XP_006688273.1 uncharacterized protein CANTEDRAFT_131521 [Yamadazyma tenuis ATCC 10573]EGV62102.1 hypothetical protein CANTEDRAFT_131521 [Yamadazyma tenuis ATCC 10573]EGV62103.1 hypothetical protein CANTEDRAFT_131521 [Yamadazyma tenuis ATCC 10573]WEJ93350.1 Protein-lysine N-methyltransferase efm4 [Yamadazyma tenuis]
MSDIRLNSSKLGTQEYWNTFYEREIGNFEHNEDDTGECWFDDSDAESKMIEFLIQKINDGELPRHYDTLNIIDLGTGNGHLLFQMYDDFEQELDVQVDYNFKGIDYSAESVDFSNKIKSKKYEDQRFEFEQVDLLKKQSDFLDANREKYDILLDKGTLDAIALNQEPVEDLDGKIGMDVYGSQVEKLMHRDSILLITSCNFTEEELVKIITKETELKVWDKITYPVFEFGGVKGSTICSIAFIKE